MIGLFSQKLPTTDGRCEPFCCAFWLVQPILSFREVSFITWREEDQIRFLKSKGGIKIFLIEKGGSLVFFNFFQKETKN